MPIKYELQEQPKYYDREKEITDGYEMEKYISFTPEFMEEIGYKNNKNAVIEQYLKDKVNYTYIGTLQCKGTNDVIEYYYNESEIVAFLVLVPSKRYYNSIQAVAIFKMKGEVC
jgi:hypothetical protein